ncbi:Actin-binding Rho-activating protein [Amphibalanus amphitrite]|uniref:Actin-binding Rho-activating protein n=1 Tax=Amphibalanus amphitrite TaxID=1232801 RepID=A0A6A4V065_AMPAM|nr:Actin-binding Rho-activating protein [Amphibalanus amphitrite]
MSSSRKIRLFSDVGAKMSMFDQRAKEHRDSQMINPFSEWGGAGTRRKLSREDPNYGRPVEGSKTAERGRLAQIQMIGDMVELCDMIYDCGIRSKDGRAAISFGDAFRLYSSINDKVVGLLMRGRKHKILDFEGEMLFQGRDDHKMIELLLPLNTIRHKYGMPERAGCGEVDHELLQLLAEQDRKQKQQRKQQRTRSVGVPPLAPPPARHQKSRSVDNGRRSDEDATEEVVVRGARRKTEARSRVESGKSGGDESRLPEIRVSQGHDLSTVPTSADSPTAPAETTPTAETECASAVGRDQGQGRMSGASDLPGGLDCCVLVRRAVVLLLLTAWVTMSVVKVQQLLSEPTSTSTHWEEDNQLPHLTICPAATINTTVATIMNKGTDKQKSALLGNKTLLEFFWTAGLKLDDMLHNVMPTDSPGEYRDFFGTFLRRSPCVTDPNYNQANCKRHCFFADMNCTLERIHNSEKRLCLAADFGYYKAYRLFKGLLTASESNCSCPVSCVRDRMERDG